MPSKAKPLGGVFPLSINHVDAVIQYIQSIIQMNDNLRSDEVANEEGNVESMVFLDGVVAGQNEIIKKLTIIRDEKLEKAVARATRKYGADSIQVKVILNDYSEE